jgi:hypothetical protein
MGEFRSRKIPAFEAFRRSRRHLKNRELAKPLPVTSRPLSCSDFRFGEFSEKPGIVEKSRRHLKNRELAKPLPERARPLSVPDFRFGEFSISGRNLSQLGSGILRDLNSPTAKTNNDESSIRALRHACQDSGRYFS